MDDRLPEEAPVTAGVFSSAHDPSTGSTDNEPFISHLPTGSTDREPFINRRRRDWHMDWGILIEVVGRIILGLFGGS